MHVISTLAFLLLVFLCYKVVFSHSLTHTHTYIPDDVFLIIKDQEGVSVMPSNVKKAGKLNSTSQYQRGKSTHFLLKIDQLLL